jgi:hypothetical protein
MRPEISGVGADQLSIIIPMVKEPTAHNQYQLLESCEPIILEGLHGKAAAGGVVWPHTMSGADLVK